MSDRGRVRVRVSVLALGVLLGWTGTLAIHGEVWACRGLAHHVLPYRFASGPVVTFSSDVEHVAFDLGSVRGRYSSWEPRLEIHGSTWAGGLVVPVVDLRTRGRQDEEGIGNPRLYGQATLVPPLGLGGGVEWDAPWGTPGVASKHGEIIPFVSMAQGGPRWDWSASLGWRVSVSGGRLRVASVHPEEPEAGDVGSPHADAHEDTARLHPLDPHQDRELLYRIGLSRTWRGARRTGIYLDGQRVLQSAPGPRTFHTVGVDLAVPALGLLWMPGFEVPVGPRSRIEWSVKLGLQPLG